MSSTIKLRRSSVPGKKPTVQQLDLGEIAINTYDGRMFFKQYQEYFDDELQDQITFENIVELVGHVQVKHTLYIQKNGNDKNTGTSWDSAFLTFEKALAVASTRNELTVIEVGPGVYYTQGHLDVPDNTVIKATHRTVFVKPTIGYEERNVFRLGSGCFLEGIIFEDWRIDDLDNPSEGFAVSFRPGAKITRVPYAHKIAVRTTPYWTTVSPPLDRENGNPLVGKGAGVILADASIISPDSIYPNIMAWGATPITHNGIGYCAKKGGLINAVNAISMWAHKHFYAIDGGQIILSACSTQFGDYTLVAKGTRQLINPYSIEGNATLIVDESSANIINSATDSIVNDLVRELKLQEFTTNWPEFYETLTKRDAALFFQTLIWTLKSANEKPLLDYANGFFNTEGNRSFTDLPYNYDKCNRDTKLITDAIKYDVLFGNNYRSIKAALSYYRANASRVITTELTNTVLALTKQKEATGDYLQGTSKERSDELFDEIIDIIQNGESNANTIRMIDPPNYDSGFYNARRLLSANKTFIQDEIDAWIAVQINSNQYPFSFSYDETTCSRDVGLIIDAIGYDLMFGSNFRTITAARSYYRNGAALVTTAQKEATVAAFTQLKSILSSIVSSYGSASTTVESLMDIIINVLGNGLSSVPTKTFTTPTGGTENAYTVVYKDARDLVELNRDFIKEEILEFIEQNFPDVSETYNPIACARDLDYILDAIYYDMTYGGNLETIISADAYFSANNLQLGTGELTATITAYEYMKSIISDISQNIAITPLQFKIDQVTSVNYGNSTTAAKLESLATIIIDTITTATSQTEILPDVSWVSATLTNAYNSLISSKASTQTSIITYINQNYVNASTFTYDEVACRRDVGYIVDALIYDLTYGGNLETYNVALAYFIGAASQLGAGEKDATIAAYTRLSDIINDISIGNSIIKSVGNSSTQDTSGIVGSIDAAAFAQNRITEIQNTIATDGELPEKITPDLTWPDDEFTISYSILNGKTDSISETVMKYLSNMYTDYDYDKCYRDTLLINQAIAYDILFGSDVRTTNAGYAYKRLNANKVLNEQLDITIQAIQRQQQELESYLTDTNSIQRSNELFAKFIDILTDGPLANDPYVITDPTGYDNGFYESRELIIQNKTFIQDEIDAWIKYQIQNSIAPFNVTPFTYDVDTCKRDIGLIIDAIGYDLMFDSNFRTITAARSYYRNGAALVTTTQKEATISAFEKLKELLVAIVSGFGTSGTVVTSLIDIIIDVLNNGLTVLPEKQLPVPTGGTDNSSDIAQQYTRDLIELNRDFIKAEIPAFIKKNYPSVFASYNQDICLRDVDYILDAVYYDMTYGGNLESVIAANAYFSGAVLQLGSGEQYATIDSYEYMKEVMYNVATNTEITPLQDYELQIFNDNAGSVQTATASTLLIDVIINAISTGTPLSKIDPDITWVNSTLVSAHNAMQTDKTTTQTNITDYINSTYVGFFDNDACRRDVGYIIDAIWYDMTYGGNLETYNAAIAYFVGNTEQLGSGEKAATLAAFARLKFVLGQIAQNILITPTTGNTTVQNNQPISYVGSIAASSFVQDRIDDIIGTISSSGKPPIRLNPDISWPGQEYIDSYGYITSNTNSIANNVLKYINIENKTLLGAILHSWEFIRDEINSLPDVSENTKTIVTEFVNALTKTVLNPSKTSEPSTITAIGHTWTGIMAGVALTKIPPVRNINTIQESILELDRGLVIASGQDDQGSALFIGGMEINADTGELAGPPFDTAVNRIATRASISRSF